MADLALRKSPETGRMTSSMIFIQDKIKPAKLNWQDDRSIWIPWPLTSQVLIITLTAFQRRAQIEAWGKKSTFSSDSTGSIQTS